ncbi:hypothetical protein CI594_21075, partial [Fischerella thermalis CCMEE 5196]
GKYFISQYFLVKGESLIVKRSGETFHSTTLLASAPSSFTFSQIQMNIKRVYPGRIVLIAVLIADNSLADVKSEYNFGFALCSEFCSLHIISKMSIIIFSLIPEVMSIICKTRLHKFNVQICR